MVVESRSVIRKAPFPKSCASYFRFARFNTFPLYYLRAWHRLHSFCYSCKMPRSPRVAHKTPVMQASWLAFPGRPCPASTSASYSPGKRKKIAPVLQATPSIFRLLYNSAPFSIKMEMGRIAWSQVIEDRRGSLSTYYVIIKNRVYRECIAISSA